MASNIPMLASSLPSDAPFCIEPIVAYRAWGIGFRKRTGKPVLRSVTYKTNWPPRRPMRAHCIEQFMTSYKGGKWWAPKHSCPDNNHRCGIYALKNEDDLRQWVYLPAHVGGLVVLWGHVYLYEKGYIAEYAYPLALTSRVDEKFANDEVGYELSRAYGLEILW